jgi:hypothetical protein
MIKMGTIHNNLVLNFKIFLKGANGTKPLKDRNNKGMERDK